MTLWYFTGGRPMKRLEYVFTDKVNGRGVWYWRDRLGRSWMAQGPWALFRVEVRP